MRTNFQIRKLYIKCIVFAKSIIISCIWILTTMLIVFYLRIFNQMKESIAYRRKELNLILHWNNFVVHLICFYFCIILLVIIPSWKCTINYERPVHSLAYNRQYSWHDFVLCLISTQRIVIVSIGVSFYFCKTFK